jgi:hypothetical protein
MRPAWALVRASCCKPHPTPRRQTWTKRRAPRGGVAWRPERSGGHDRSRTWRQDQIYRKADKVKRRTAGGLCFKSLNWRTPGERILRVTLEIEPLLVISGPRQCANSNASVTRGVVAHSNAANDSLLGMRLLPEEYRCTSEYWSRMFENLKIIARTTRTRRRKSSRDRLIAGHFGR